MTALAMLGIVVAGGLLTIGWILPLRPYLRKGQLVAEHNALLNKGLPIPELSRRLTDPNGYNLATSGEDTGPLFPADLVDQYQEAINESEKRRRNSM